MRKIILAAAATAATLIAGAAAAQPYGYNYSRGAYGYNNGYSNSYSYRYDNGYRDSDRDGISDRAEWGPGREQRRLALGREACLRLGAAFGRQAVPVGQGVLGGHRQRPIGEARGLRCMDRSAMEPDRVARPRQPHRQVAPAVDFLGLQPV